LPSSGLAVQRPLAFSFRTTSPRNYRLDSRLFSDAAFSDDDADNSDNEESTENSADVPAATEDETETIPIGKSKVNAVTFNLIKAIAGSGVLALPSGLAAMSDFKMSLVPALGLMTVLGGVSAYTFALYGRLVHASQAKSLGELWEKKKDKRSAWFVSLASMTFCFGACLSYSILLGDVSSSMAQTVGWSGIFATRQFWIIALTTTILFPLCNLRSLLALAPLSLAGVAAVLITTLFIAWRCPLANTLSPYVAPAGKLLKTLSKTQLPLFNTFNNGLFHPSSLILLGMSASAYL
ncbi:MAG: hypothetical protein SGILL_009995, partial [Bacillariaceae sp.]